MTMTEEEAPRRSTADLAGELEASGALDALFDRIDSGEARLTGEGGLLPALVKAALERGLKVELDEHLGYEKGAPDAAEFPNSRNGTTAKRLATEAGPVDLEVPRDREGTFSPRLVPKGQRRLGGLDEIIISLYAGGMTIRDIQHHLATTIGTDLSRETISKITDEILEEVMAWQQRPLETFYPVVYLDALVVKIRNGPHVANRSAHIAVGVDLEGIKHVLGIWVQASEGAKFWAGVCAELANRGVKDVLFVCCDGLVGLPEAVEATWPNSMIQTCVVHLIRASMRFVAYHKRKSVASALKTIYQAPSEDAARAALDEFAASELGKSNPNTIAVFERSWDRFVPFLAFPPMLRRVLYTTNAIESLNYQLRKVIKNRGHFPSDEAAVKLLWLAICNIEDKRALEREKHGTPAGGGSNKADGRLVEGQVTTNWKQALGQLVLAYPERIEPYL